ncbi:MAG: Tol-Pal system protein TolQ [Chlamydiae bacterium]|nr:Tol-Pal system protein TolQ [Chlamydiota bacterium]
MLKFIENEGLFMKKIFGFLLMASSLLNAQELQQPNILKSNLDLVKVFKGAPIIYSVLILLSVVAFIIWLYSFFTLKLSDMMPSNFIHQIRTQLTERRFDAALITCQQDQNFSSNVIACGIAARKHGPQVMMEAMHAEGKRCSNALWQRISILNDIAVVAPMLGLLGTVLGMFYAFYDANRSQESFSSIFDGLGVAMGTTVLGLFVAIAAMIFHTTLKYRVVRLMSCIENEALSLGSLIETELVTA